MTHLAMMCYASAFGLGLIPFPLTLRNDSVGYGI
jgi:hypothetical protein